MVNYIEFLLNYYTDIKNNKLRSLYKLEVAKQQQFKDYMNMLENKNTKYKALEQAGGKAQVIEKLERIQHIFNVYTSTSSDDDLVDKYYTVNKKIQDILDVLNKVNVEDINSVDDIYNRDAVVNSMDTLMATMKHVNGTLQLNTDRQALVLKPSTDFQDKDDIDNMSQMEFMLNGIKKEFMSIMEHKDESDYGKRLDAILIKLKEMKKNSKFTELDELLTKYDRLVAFFKEKNNNYEQLLLPTISNEDLSIVEELDKIHMKIMKLKALKKQDIDKICDDLNKLYENKQLRDYVVMYNNVVHHLSHLLDEYQLPSDYFDGSYTDRVKTNVLNAPKQMTDKFDIVSQLVDINTVAATNNDIRMSYKPIFSKTEPVSYSQQGGGESTAVLQQPRLITPSSEPSQASQQLKPLQLKQADTTPKVFKLKSKTNNDTKIKLSTEKQFEADVTGINSKLDILNARIVEYEKEVDKYNRNQINLIYHTSFLMLISTNQLLVNNYIVFKFMNKGVLQYYYRIIDSINSKIESADTKPEIVYLKKYHYMTVKILKHFCYELIQKLGTNDIINIKYSGKSVRDGFHLLNHFKDILDSYNRLFQNKITIYGRINDWGDILKQNYEKKLFVSDYDMDKKDKHLGKLTVQRNTCKQFMDNSGLGTEPKDELLFTEVFDTNMYPNNGVISNYMSLQNTLTSGTGTALMTYGYSGVGKTFTLFGSSKGVGGKSIEGMLQSTLNNISGLRYMKFRLFELYGYGVAYPHYWNMGLKEVKQVLYSYYIHINDGKMELKDIGGTVMRNVESDGIQEYTTKDTDYIMIHGDKIKDIFKNFDLFTDQVDDNRMKIGTIRETPNNPVSSRSMLVYDFKLYIEDDTGESKEVPFIIIDLPGREEIVQSYVEAYVKKPIPQIILTSFMQDQTDKLSLRTALAAMTLNPLALPVIYLPYRKNDNTKQISNIIIQYINSLNKEKRELIFMTKLKDSFRKQYNNEYMSINQARGEKVLIQETDEVTLFEEGISVKQSDNINTLFTLYLYFDMTKDGKIKMDGNTINRKKEYAGYTESKPFQYESLICIHIINRLIILKQFDIMKEMFEKIANSIINEYIQNYISKMNEQQIRDMLKKYNKTPNSNIREQLYDIAKFDYLLTPYEGIYINENIIGMIQYLSQKLTVEEVKDFIHEQDKNLDFKTQQQNVRTLLRNYSNNLSIRPLYQGDNDYFGYKKYGDKYRLEEVYDEFKSTYKSDHIFNKERPIITDILDHYISKIDDYKVFYLLSNTSMDLKCEHQIKLLNNTKSFVQTIVKDT